MNVSNCRLTRRVTCHGVVCALTIIHPLQSNFRLQELDLSHNELCEEGGIQIGPSLGTYVHILNWQVLWTCLSFLHAITCALWHMYILHVSRVCISVHRKLPSSCYCCCSGDSEALHTLDLSWNHLRGKGVTALAAGLKVSPVHTWLCYCYYTTRDTLSTSLCDVLPLCSDQ